MLLPPDPSASSRGRGILRALAHAAVVGCAATGLAGAVGLAIELAGGRPTALFRDPAAFHRFPAWHGSFSLLGVVLMASTCAVTSFAAVATARLRNSVGLLSLVAGYSGFFALDDGLLLHESVLPAVGVPEGAVLLVHAAVLAWVVRTVVHDAPSLLPRVLVALGLLGCSAVVDQLPVGDAGLGVLAVLEDSCKIGAIVTWTWCWVSAALDAVAGAPSVGAGRGGGA